MINLNSQSTAGPTVTEGGGGQTDAQNQVTASMTTSQPSNGHGVSSAAGTQIVQSNGLRKSMQGSTTGLRSLQSTMSTNNQLQQQQQQLQQHFQGQHHHHTHHLQHKHAFHHQQFHPTSQGRTSHSSHPHQAAGSSLQNGSQFSMPLTMNGSHSQHAQQALHHHGHTTQSTYHSVAAQSRIQQSIGSQQLNGTSAAPGALASNGLFSQTLANGASGLSQKGTTGVGFHHNNGNGAVTLLNYNYGSSLQNGMLAVNGQTDNQTATSSANVSGVGGHGSNTDGSQQTAHHTSSLMFQNQNGFAAQKQFSIGTQQHHGLFPKIMNLRDNNNHNNSNNNANQTVPNNTHNNPHTLISSTTGQTAPGGPSASTNQMTSTFNQKDSSATTQLISSSATAALNILKHSGGHISGMSTHQLPAQLFLFEGGGAAAAATVGVGSKEIERLAERQHSRGMQKVVNYEATGGSSVDGGGAGVTGVMRNAAQNGFGGTGTLPLKPLSSPRSSQQHGGGGTAQHEGSSLESKVLSGIGATSTSQGDPNTLYQQQLQWKTKSSLAQSAEDGKAAQNAIGGSVTRASESTIIVNGAGIQQPLVSSPGPMQLPGAAQIQYEPQRAKQISGGSEKRLKMQQQRQYYSDQYRVQQQRQHQQTANAVLSQSGAASACLHAAISSQQQQTDHLQQQQKVNQRLEQMQHLRTDQIGKGADTILINYRVGAAGAGGAQRAPVGVGDTLTGQRLPDAYHAIQMNGNRSGKIHSSQQTQVVQVLTPQLYSQQRQRVATGILPMTSNAGVAGVSGIHNPSQQMVVANTAPGTASSSLNIPNGTQINGVTVATANALLASGQHQQQQQLGQKVLGQVVVSQQQPLQGPNGHQHPTMNASQSYQQPNGKQQHAQILHQQQQVFFKKRASSNTNPAGPNAQSIVQQGSPTKPPTGDMKSHSGTETVHPSAGLDKKSEPKPSSSNAATQSPKTTATASGSSSTQVQGQSQQPTQQTSSLQQPPQSHVGHPGGASQDQAKASGQGQIGNGSQQSQQQATSTNSTQPNSSSAQQPSSSGTSAATSQQQSQQQTQQQQQQQQQQPKIPVICGFHKRILLITCQGPNNNGTQGTSGSSNSGNGAGCMNSNLSLSQARRIRNKNPNCNHNSNSVFYQPHYNNVKYDDSHKKKEDVLRKVFFKECAKEEEKRIYNGSAMTGPGGQYGHGGIGGPGMTQGSMYAGVNEAARQQALSQANDPNKHLQIIERILCEYLFVSLPFDRTQKQQLSNTQSLMMELGLDRALTPHRGFLLALIRAGKFNAENMLKVLSEVKTSATEFDNECIYCKYSQYALKESQKLLQKHQAALAEQAQTNPQQALAQQQQIQANGGIIKGPSGEDIRIENLVRMFQSQLFKKSFINTSLMIIQRKMTEKYFQKYQNAKQAQQAAANGQGLANGAGVQYGPDGKPMEGVRRPAKKARPKQQNLSSLEYLSKEIQKLSKNLANPRDKERYLDLKEKYYREFLIKILKSNGVEKIQFPHSTFTPYKYYIGRGNNSGIVRTALKSRFWWSMGDYDDWDDYNFIWTQWKSNKILACLKSWKEVQEQEQKEADKKRSSQSTRGGPVDSQLSTQATDKESTSSKENLITTPKKSKLASASLGNTSSEIQFKKTNSATAHSSAAKNSRVFGRGGKKADDKDEEKEENHTSHNLLLYSKMENNYHLSNKKAIYYNMKVYYEAIGKEYHHYLPLTFHIKEGLNDPQFLKFEQLYHDATDSNKSTVLDQFPKFGKTLWIVKPGENTNRGCGIQVSRDIDHIKSLVQNTNVNGNRRSYIIQKYIEKPLLYKGRKFDIRCFTMMCTISGNLQGYWYTDGYLRTSSREFTIKNVSNRYVHLTNDAVQKKLDDYGKFESGNKLSYQEFQKYLDSQGIKCDFAKDVTTKIRQLIQDSMRAVSRKIDPSRKNASFEIFGYDFMIDEDLNTWMIEVNTNPCFELSSPYLARLIPAMVENALKIAVDPLFPPPPIPASKKHTCPDAMENKFELVFNERDDANELKNLPIDDNMNGIIEEEEMEEEGSDIEEEEDENH